MGLAPDWERPVWSREMRSLIREWDTLTGDGKLSDLKSYGWFCECQDWDEKNFAWERVSSKGLDQKRIEVGVTVQTVQGSSTNQRLVMQQEDGQWVVHNLFSASVPNGLRSALQAEIKDP